MSEEKKNEEKVEFPVEEEVKQPTQETVQQEEKTDNHEHKSFKEKKLHKEIEALKKEKEDLQHELEVAKNAYYKAYADTDNLKKRLQKEAEQANKYRIQTFASEILPAIDSLERALEGKDEQDPFIKGVKLTYDKLMNALSQEGITTVDCLNKPFDANYANALMSEKVEGVEPNMVVEVLQKGYMLKDRLLRAALVKVSE